MSTLSLFVAAAIIGFAAGCVFFSVNCARHSYEVWEVTTLDGDKWLFDNPGDVNECVKIAGHVAVRRLRVLT